MKFGEFKEKIIENYHSVFPNSACTVTLGALGGDTAFVTYYLAGDQSEFPNNISQNDLFNIQFFIKQNIDRDETSTRLTEDTELVEPLTMECDYKMIKTKPEKQYLAFGSVSLPFRKTVGSADKIILTLKKYAEVTKITLEDLYKSDRLPTNQQKNIIDLVKSKLGLTESTKKTEGIEIIDEINPNPEIGKSYAYRLKHGIGPGTLPKDVKIKKYVDLNNFWTIVYLDRPLTQEELDYYDIPSETKKIPDVDKFIDYSVMAEDTSTLNESNYTDNDVYGYNFSIVLHTSNPESEEFKKLEHHIEYLVDFNSIDYPMSVFSVTVEPSGKDRVIVKGELEIENTEYKLSTDDVANDITYAINETGWEDLDVSLESVSVTEYKEENKKLQEDDYNEIEGEDTMNDDALQDILNDLKNINGFYEFVIEDILADCEDYNGDTLKDKIISRCNEILEHGCVSGTVSSLIYYSDTTEAFNKYEEDLYDIVEEYDVEIFLEVLKSHVNTEELIMRSTTSENWIVWIAYEWVTLRLSDALQED